MYFLWFVRFPTKRTEVMNLSENQITATAKTGSNGGKNLQPQIEGDVHTATYFRSYLVYDSADPFLVVNLCCSKMDTQNRKREGFGIKNKIHQWIRISTWLNFTLLFIAFTSVFKSNNENIDTIFVPNGTVEIIRSIISNKDVFSSLFEIPVFFRNC